MAYEKTNNSATAINILLVDDDKDDYSIFEEALQSQVFETCLYRVVDGDNLMAVLNDEAATLPDVIFLDINMPGKNGYDCLLEMKDSKRLENIPVIIYSTSYQKDVADVLCDLGANFYIKKPNDFTAVKDVLQKALCYISQNEDYIPTSAHFLL